MKLDPHRVQDAANKYDLAETLPSEVPLARLHSDVLERQLVLAEIAAADDFLSQRRVLEKNVFDDVKTLSNTHHASRGVALTLAAYKIVRPTQDIRRHKAEHANGFSARSIDHQSTVPFLQSKSLSYNVDTHWLSQTFSFAGPYILNSTLKTTPKSAGPLLLRIVDAIERNEKPVEVAEAVVQVLLAGLIDERNKGKVLLEKPKDLAIDQVMSLLEAHLAEKYSKNSPRLPQLAIYAIYKCMIGSMDRYAGLQLGPLERMKAANRKSGSVGDIDINRSSQPVEAVEVKMGFPITIEHVAEAIQKIKTVSVERYLILSTVGVAEKDAKEIRRLQIEFKRSNGCEIIVNGVFDTIKYYLRLIRSTTDFIFEYTSLVQEDADLGYEHRLKWNEICVNQLG